MQRALLPILTVFLILVAPGCKKSQQFYFPDVPFEEYIYLSNPSNQDLQHPGGWVYHPGGYKGLIVFRRHLQGGAQDFGVYDRGCPEHYSEDCGRLEVSDDELYAVCPCDGARHLLIDGSPGQGARYPLRTYRVSLNGNVLYVRN